MFSRIICSYPAANSRATRQAASWSCLVISLDHTLGLPANFGRTMGIEMNFIIWTEPYSMNTCQIRSYLQVYMLYLQVFISKEFHDHYHFIIEEIIYCSENITVKQDSLFQ